MRTQIFVADSDSPLMRRAPVSGSIGVDERSELQLGLAWLLRLRWGAVAAQVLVLVVVKTLLRRDLPYAPLFALVAFTAVGNLVLAREHRWGTRPWILSVVVYVDVVTLTLMLALSGSATNPFTLFLLVHVALAALLLGPTGLWALVALTIVAYGSLFVFAWNPVVLAHSGSPWSSYLLGTWVAYGLAASFIAHFVGKFSSAIRERDRRLAAVRNMALQNERLANLSNFSANAAHELGSPLATIGLAAKEIALGIEHGKQAVALMPDVKLICQEVMRCRDILSDLSSRAGESVGEMPVLTTASRIVADLVSDLSLLRSGQVRVEWEMAPEDAGEIVAPAHTLTQLLTNLLRNAFEAQEDAGVDDPIEMRVVVAERLCFRIFDCGIGVPEAIRGRLGEPFVTTKEQRGGLGLGVYLARAYADRTGGHLLFRARPTGGSEVELCLPRNVIADGHASEI